MGHMWEALEGVKGAFSSLFNAFVFGGILAGIAVYVMIWRVCARREGAADLAGWIRVFGWGQYWLTRTRFKASDRIGRWVWVRIIMPLDLNRRCFLLKYSNDSEERKRVLWGLPSHSAVAAQEWECRRSKRAVNRMLRTCVEIMIEPSGPPELVSVAKESWWRIMVHLEAVCASPNWIRAEKKYGLARRGAKDVRQLIKFIHRSAPLYGHNDRDLAPEIRYDLWKCYRRLWDELLPYYTLHSSNVDACRRALMDLSQVQGVTAINQVSRIVNDILGKPMVQDIQDVSTAALRELEVERRLLVSGAEEGERGGGDTDVVPE